MAPSEKTYSGGVADVGTLRRLLVHGWMKRSGITMQIIDAALGKTAPTTLRLFGEQQVRLDAPSSNVTAVTPSSHAITTHLATMLETDHTETWLPSVHNLITGLAFQLLPPPPPASKLLV